MPVFAIHGNHDPPVSHTAEAETNLCEGSLDLLSTAGFLNNFGNVEITETTITVEPIVFKKNEIWIALYGIGYIKDIKLKRYFNDPSKKIIFKDPWEFIPGIQMGDNPFCYKILVLHQNRCKGFNNGAPSSKCIMGEEIPSDLFHLIIWGHEHEAISKPEWMQGCQSYVFQPGSSVQTSLCKAESKQKGIGILKVYPQNKQEIDWIDLINPRPLHLESLLISELSCYNQVNQIDEDLLIKILEERLQKL